MNGSAPSFDVSGIIKGIVGQAEEIVAKDTGKAALSIFLLLFLLHIVEGAAELSEKAASCRLLRPKFWLRLFLVGALLAGYGKLAAATVNNLQARFMMDFAAKWAEVWDQERSAINNIRQAEQENSELSQKEAGIRASKDDDSWISKLGRSAGEHIVSWLGFLLSALAGLVITLLILMEGFWCMGINVLLIVVGPMCIAFAAHEKTEGITWSFLRGFLVYGLLYMPMLGVACRFAGVVMARISRVTSEAGIVYGDGSDIAVHFLLVLVGPICAYAVVRGVPAFVSSVIGGASLGGGAGGSFDTARSLAGAAVSTAGRHAAAVKGGGNGNNGGGGDAPQDSGDRGVVPTSAAPTVAAASAEEARGQ